MAFLLVVTENGYGLLMENKYTLRHRGKLGNKSITTRATGDSRNGKALRILNVKDPKKQNVCTLSASGQVAKFPLSEMRVLSSNSKGVRVMDLAGKDTLVDAVIV